MVMFSGGGAGNFIHITCDVAGCMRVDQRSGHPSRIEEIYAPFSSLSTSYFLPPAASIKATSFQKICISGFPDPLLINRTFAVNELPLRRNSVTSAVTPGQFVSCDWSDAVAGVAGAGAGAGAGAAVDVLGML